jgi:hypothetical protein
MKDYENSKMGHLLVACLAAEEHGVKAVFISRELQKKCLRFTVLSVLGERFTGPCHRALSRPRLCLILCIFIILALLHGAHIGVAQHDISCQIRT